MSGYAQMLIEKRANVWEQAKALLDRATEEKRELSAEEQTQYDAMSADLDGLRSQIDKIAKDQEANKAAEESLRKLADQQVDEERRAPDAAQRSLETEFRQIATGQLRSSEVKVTKAQANHFYSKRNRDAWLAAEERALSIGTATAGGDLVPTGFYDTLVRHLIADSAIIAAGATVLHTSTGESLQVPTTTAYSTGTLTTEGSALTESDPAFAQRTLGAYKYGALMTVSNELLTDSAFPLVPFLSDQAAEGVVNTLGTDLVTGSGSSKPRGIVTDASSGVTGGTGVSGVPSMDDLINLEYSVIAKYRRNAAWLMADGTAGKIRTLKASGTGTYLWQPSLQIGSPDTLDGYPVHTDPNVAATATSAKSVLFGDFSRYFVRIVNSIRFERSDDYSFNTDQVAFRCIIRADGALIDRTGAVKYYVGGAS